MDITVTEVINMDLADRKVIKKKYIYIHVNPKMAVIVATKATMDNRKFL
jgi:hypothetical protein